MLAPLSGPRIFTVLTCNIQLFCSGFLFRTGNGPDQRTSCLYCAQLYFAVYWSGNNIVFFFTLLTKLPCLHRTTKGNRTFTEMNNFVTSVRKTAAVVAPRPTPMHWTTLATEYLLKMISPNMILPNTIWLDWSYLTWLENLEQNKEEQSRAKGLNCSGQTSSSWN